MNANEKLLNALKIIQTKVQNGNVLSSQGICTDVYELLGDKSIMETLSSIMAKWPAHSGSLEYPIPSTHPKLNYFEIYWSTDNYWIGQYGQLRRELLHFCINELVRMQHETN